MLVRMRAQDTVSPSGRGNRNERKIIGKERCILYSGSKSAKHTESIHKFGVGENLAYGSIEEVRIIGCTQNSEKREKVFGYIEHYRLS